MDRITLQNYRCFREKQSARLAPLTFLLGENSTGKTSFLALIRALWQVAFFNTIPDFRQDPYDLGVFEDIIHGAREDNVTSESFNVELEFADLPSINAGGKYRVTFENRQGYPFPSVQKFIHGDLWAELESVEGEHSFFRFGDTNSRYEVIHRDHFYSMPSRMLSSFNSAFFDVLHDNEEESSGKTREDADKDEGQLAMDRTGTMVEEKLDRFMGNVFRSDIGVVYFPFASAPIRSRPKRTYDPSRPTPDPEGEYIPDYLANMSRSSSEQWNTLKSDLEDFGRDAGLFDEITVLSFGKTAGAPFQVQIRKFGKRLRGPKRNLIDVGYGVSQALPILIELLREDSPRMFLLQQPEVHLHPRAQAALGSFFCNLAASGKQIIVETHSDYILDRARMDIRDGKSDLKAEDISILYFERNELDVNIHSLRVDEEGNVLDAPPGYGQFFMDEMRRSVGL